MRAALPISGNALPDPSQDTREPVLVRTRNTRCAIRVQTRRLHPQRHMGLLDAARDAESGPMHP
jgi:hypothetical protein